MRQTHTCHFPVKWNSCILQNCLSHFVLFLPASLPAMRNDGHLSFWRFWDFDARLSPKNIPNNAVMSQKHDCTHWNIDQNNVYSNRTSYRDISCTLFGVFLETNKHQSLTRLKCPIVSGVTNNDIYRPLWQIVRDWLSRFILG